MELGDRVIFYTHVASDVDHSVDDTLALVTRVGEDGAPIGVAILPDGGPLMFWKEVSQYDPDDPYLVPGMSYWREPGTEPPDLAEPFAYADRPEWAAMQRRQAEEVQKYPDKADELREKHLAERQELYDSLKGVDNNAEA